MSYIYTVISILLLTTQSAFTPDGFAFTHSHTQSYTGGSDCLVWCSPHKAEDETCQPLMCIQYKPIQISARKSEQVHDMTTVRQSNFGVEACEFEVL